MTTKTVIFASLVLPMIMAACGQEDQSPTAAVPGEERQAQAPTTPDRTMENAPPAAGTPPPASEAPAAGAAAPTPSTPTTPPSEPARSDSQQQQPNEPVKSY